MFIEKETGLTWHDDGEYRLRTDKCWLGDNSILYTIQKDGIKYDCYYHFNDPRKGTQVGWLWVCYNLDEAVNACDINYRINYPEYTR